MENQSSPLKNGTILNSGSSTYRIVRVLGQGGFGITYLAVAEIQVGNVTTEVQFAVKEHFPSNFCLRDQERVVPREDAITEFNRSKDDFISEAKKLHSLGSDNDNIVKVNEVFESNGTAYYIMQYINGYSLYNYIKKNGPLSYRNALNLLLPIFEGVQFLHNARINHLDIKPDNIMLHQSISGVTPVLIDFGQSMHFRKNGNKTSTKGIMGVSEGYSPLEQYAGITTFSPVTDIYALAATLLFTLTGKTPDSASKIKLSDVRKELEKVVPKGYIEGICQALNKSSDERTSTIKELKSNLGLCNKKEGTETEVLELNSKRTKNNKIKYLILACLIIAVVGGCAIYLRTCNKDSVPVKSESARETIVSDSIEMDQNESLLEPQSTELEKTATEKPGQTVDETKAQTKIHKTEEDENNGKNVSNPDVHTDVVRTGSLSLGYGTWTGGIKNGKMDGTGTIVFTSSHRIPGSSQIANPGERLNATFSNGQIERGKLYDSEGNLIKSIY